MTTADTYVAEYQVQPSGSILYKVVHEGDPGIVYVEVDKSGRMEASSLSGRGLPDTPAAVRATVTRYRREHGA